MSHGSDRSASEGRTEKRIGLAVAAALMAVILFSALFRLFEADHDCAGDDCPICACIQQCELILNQFTNGVVAQAAVAVAVSLLVLAVAISAYTFIQATPVSRKVQLNN